MIENVLLVHSCGCAIKLANDHPELAAGITEHRRVVYALNSVENEWPTRPYSVVEMTLLSQAVRIPRHKSLSIAGQRRNCLPRLRDNSLVSNPGRIGRFNTELDAYGVSGIHLTSGSSRNATISLHPAS